MSEIVYLSNVRLSFPKLIEAEGNKDFPNAPKKFGCDLILAPNDPQFAKFMAEIGKCAAEKWKEHANNVLQMIGNDKRLRCWGNGTEKIKKDTFKPYDGYEGMAYISASSDEDRPPQIVGLDGAPIDNANTMQRNAAARKLYGGCFVNAAVRPWAQDNQYGRGMRCQLIAIQFAKDGDAFGEGNADVSGMFGAVQSPQPGAFPPNHQWNGAQQAPQPTKMPWEQ